MKKGLLFIFMLVLAVACKEQPAAVIQQGEAPEVPVAVVQPQSIHLSKRYPADIIGKEYVNIVPKISGYVEKWVAKEGAKVRKGEVILKISEDNYIQAVRASEANVAVAKASVENAKLDVEKTQSLYDNKIVSQFDLKAAKNNLLLTEAQLKQAEADLQNSRINLGYTNVISPVDGVIGTINAFPGTLVSPADPTPITTVSDSKNMYAYFTMSEVDILNLTRNSKGGNISEGFKNPQLILANGANYSKEGKLDMISGIVDKATGTITLRASFENDGNLRGGSNGYIILPIALENAILVPQNMTTSQQDKVMVYVVDAENNIISKLIKVMNETYEDKFVVTEGLAEGDKVVVSNAIKLRPGMKVKPIVK